jgi:hypothetical protein
VTARARAAFDVERVTKRFYDQFKTEHKAFLDFISGITELADKEWYHLAAVGLFVAHFNFCRVHEAHRVTPAMAQRVAGSAVACIVLCDR